jgi:two-component system, NtrC family, response regulator GlrR
LAVDGPRDLGATSVDPAGASIAFRRCRVTVVRGPDLGATIEVAAPTIRIGAASGCDLVLADRSVSRHHVEIGLEVGGYRIRDLGSTNGTWVAGVRVLDGFLAPGAVIQCGETRLSFEALALGDELSLPARDRLGGLVGASLSMRHLYAQIERVAATDSTVLVGGETGTGKEVAARAIHDGSPRAGGPFVVLDCGAISPTLIGSELFGHERGAFTGATAAYAGAFERADGGTIFLDEIGELPIDQQPSLLGVLERREVRRLGGARPREVDVRVVAASNRDLGAEVNSGRFRADLYYRLAVVHLRIPALRDHLEDLPLLVDHFLAEMPGAPLGLPADALERLAHHSFPGNVRELRNLVERMALFDELTLDGPGAADAPGPADRQPASRVEVEVTTQPYRTVRDQALARIERRYFEQMLEAHDSNLTAVARAAGVDRMTVYRMLERCGLRRGTDEDG